MDQNTAVLDLRGLQTPGPDKTFPVAEIFGPTIQGEGYLAGMPCAFIRFGGCDYKCAWCDSMHAVDPERVRNLPRMTVAEIVANVVRVAPHVEWVILSGGNPFLHDLSDVVNELAYRHYKISVETQGSLVREWIRNVDHVTVSPKGPSAQLTQKQVESQFKHIENFMQTAKKIAPRTKVDLKFPIFDEADLYFAQTVHHNMFPNNDWYLSVGNDIASGDTRATLLLKYRWLIESALSHKDLFATARILPQLHVLVWGNDQGH